MAPWEAVADMVEGVESQRAPDHAQAPWPLYDPKPVKSSSSPGGEDMKAECLMNGLMSLLKTAMVLKTKQSLTTQAVTTLRVHRLTQPFADSQ